jgi:hypothetical protein
MNDWISISDSSRVVAIAYDPEQEAILARFPDGVEWQYLGCPQDVWDDFTALGTSKGRFIKHVLNTHIHGPLDSTKRR